jgi:hypothetical protein
MKAIIKVCTASKDFSADQKQIIRRIANVLSEHGLSVSVTTKIKQVKQFNLKAS